MDIFQSRYYKVHSYFAMLIGQWPYQNSKTKLYRRIILCGLLLISVNQLVLKFFTAELNANLFIDISLILLICICVVVKYVTCCFNADSVKELTDRITDDWKILNVQNEINILRKYTEQGRAFGIFYSEIIHISSVTVAILYSAFTMFSAVQLLPKFLDIVSPLNESRAHYAMIKAENFFNEEEHFVLYLLLSLCGSLLAMTVVVATDIMFITFMHHASGMCNVFGYKLEHAFDALIRPSCDFDTYSKCYLEVARCVQYHKNILEYVDILNNCYSVSYLIQTFLAMVSFSLHLFQLYQAILFLKDIYVIATCLVLLSCQFIVMVLSIIPAQRLLDDSNNTFYKAYSGQWYLASFEMQKAILFIMQKCKKPCGLTAVSTITMCCESFSSVIQASLSYFMVLCSLQ